MKKWQTLLALIMVFSLSLSGLAYGNVQAANDSIVRLQGQDRYETAAKIALNAYPDGATTLILARGDIFADGLAGSALAGALDAPILLTSSNRLPSSTADAIDILGATEVVLLGGTGAISEAVKAELEELGLEVTRIYGDDRYETAVMIAKKIAQAMGDDFPGTAFIVSGTAMADSLLAGTVAAMHSYPTLLVRKDSVPQVTADAIAELGIKNLFIIGGNGVVSDAVYTMLGELVDGDVERVWGDDRSGTSVAVARRFFTNPLKVILASGRTLVDALAGGYFGALKNAPILLTQSLPDVVQEYLDEIYTEETKFFILGGTSAVGTDVEDQLRDLVSPPPPPPPPPPGVPTVVPVAGISINQENQSLVIGSTMQLSVTYNPANATNKSITWASDDNDVATVAPNGTVEAIGIGTATITVTTADGGFTDTIEITVEAIQLNMTSVPDQLSTVVQGRSYSFTVTVTDQFGNPAASETVNFALWRITPLVSIENRNLLTNAAGQATTSLIVPADEPVGDNKLKIIIGCSGDNVVFDNLNVLANAVDGQESSVTRTSDPSVTAGTNNITLDLGIAITDGSAMSGDFNVRVTRNTVGDWMDSSIVSFNAQGEATIQLSITGAGVYSGVKVEVESPAGTWVEIGQFDVTVVADSADSMTSTPDALASIALGASQQFIVTVFDEYGNPVAGETVTFAVTGVTGTSAFSEASQNTNAQGQASSTLNIDPGQAEGIDVLTVTISHTSIAAITIADIDVVIAFAGGDGTEADPYQIQTAQQLHNVRYHLDAHFELIADINLNGWNWEPIGTSSSNTFSGSFDGGNHTISDLSINRPDTDFVALFGYIGGRNPDRRAVIKDLSLNNVTVIGKNDAAALVGISIISDIINCHAENVDVTAGTGVSSVGGLVGSINGDAISGRISGSSVTGLVVIQASNSNSIIGGLVGSVAVSQVKIENSFVSASPGSIVIGINDVGGLVGSTQGVVDTCYVTGIIVNGANNVGGLAGQNTHEIVDSSATNVTVIATTTRAGGLVGYNRFSGTISRSHASATVIATSNAGGLVGTHESGNITRSYSEGSVSAGGNVGGLVGFNGSTSTIDNSYSWTNVEIRSSGGLGGGLVGRSMNTTGGGITHCYSIGIVGMEHDYYTDTGAGGLFSVDSAWNFEVVASYYDLETSGRTDTGKGEPKTTAQMKDPVTFSAWDNTIWHLVADQYPVLKWQIE